MLQSLALLPLFFFLALQEVPSLQRQSFLARLNQERSAAGLPPLRLNQASFQSVTDADYQDLGIGITDFQGTPLYTFVLAWRETEFFARQTAPLEDLERVRAEMLATVNARREAVGAAPLVLDPRLNDAAQKHAEDMLSRSYYNHRSLEELQPRDRVVEAGYRPFVVVENIARGHTTVEEAMDAWMQSRGHRGNLLNAAFTEMGVGCAVGRNAGGYTVLWVQDFGRALPLRR